MIGQVTGRDWGPPDAIVTDQGAPVGVVYVNPPSGSESPAGGESVVSTVNRALLLIAVGAGVVAVLIVLGVSRRVFAPAVAWRIWSALG